MKLTKTKRLAIIAKHIITLIEEDEIDINALPPPQNDDQKKFADQALAWGKQQIIGALRSSPHDGTRMLLRGFMMYLINVQLEREAEKAEAMEAEVAQESQEDDEPRIAVPDTPSIIIPGE